MQRNRQMEEKIITVLRNVRAGKTVARACHEASISPVSYSMWRKKHGRVGVKILNQLAQLKEENDRLRQSVARLRRNQMPKLAVFRWKTTDSNG